MSQMILNELEALRPILTGRRFLLVRGGSYDRLPMKSFFDGFDHVEFSGFTPNPLYEQVCRGVDLFRRENCSLVVAVGGGSAMDVAKCIKLFCRMNPEQNYLTQEYRDTGVPLVAVPTTAGTGSESTRHAVIYYQGEKQSVSHGSIVPDYAVLDHTALRELPLYQKKCTMLDALCQAIESWWSVSSTEESARWSQKAIEAIMENWQAYLFDGQDAAAEQIMLAANYAGRAINITATTAAHAMSYKLTSLYGLPHGHAVALCLSEVWAFILSHPERCSDGRGIGHLTDTMTRISRLISLEQFRSMLEKMEMSCPHARNREEELTILSCSVNPLRLKNNPTAITQDELRILYGRIVKE